MLRPGGLFVAVTNGDDHAAAVAYLSSFDATMAERLPWFEGAREYTGTPTVFLAR